MHACTRLVVGASALAALAALVAAEAQWIHYPTPGLPRTADGELDRDAAPPALENGKPDLSGLWEHDDPLRYYLDITADLEDGAPTTEWGRQVLEQRMARRGVDDPNNYCLPTGIVGKHAVPAPFKILQQPDLLVILYESRTTYRQIFTDGRPFPVDPQPSWHGYSVGHWDGDTLVVESMGFNGMFWLDARGHPATEELRVIERFSRPAFGRLEVEITIEDPKAYARPWTVKQTMHYLPDTELIEHICEENNRFFEQIGIERPAPAE